VQDRADPGSARGERSLGVHKFEPCESVQAEPVPVIGTHQHHEHRLTRSAAEDSPGR
jgi:hypothetical protein